MITLSLTFLIFLVIFGVIGAMRGWAKELLVSFSVVVSLFILDVIGKIPQMKNIFDQTNKPGFWLPALLLIILVFAGYQTPILLRFASGKFAREKLADLLLGLFIGLLNGYLIIGTLWFLLEKTGYPFAGITKPADPLVILNYLPPDLLSGTALYAAVGISFLFVLLVFI